jgi:hypothetical protein
MLHTLHDIDKYLRDHKDFKKTATTALLVWTVCLKSDFCIAQARACVEKEPLARAEYLTTLQAMKVVIYSLDEELTRRGVTVNTDPVI